MNIEYLEKFFRNLLLGETNELKNRYVHIRYKEEVAKSVTANITQNVTVKLTKNQKKILELVKENPVILQEEIATKLGVARETVSRNMTKLQAMNLLEHVGADKNGCWKVKN